MVERIERTTVIFGLLLVLLALGTYAYSAFASFTALVPLLPGSLLVLSGLAGRRERWRSWAMHVAVVVGFISVLPLFMGLARLRPLLTGEELTRPLAAVEMTLMGLISLFYVVICIKYFLNRRQKSG